MEDGKTVIFIIILLIVLLETIYAFTQKHKAKTYRALWMREVDRHESMERMAVIDEIMEKEAIEMREVFPDERN